MKEEFRELYQDIILDHNRSPRNFRKMDDPTHVLEGRNPLCGDHYTIYLKVNGDVIEDVSFEGSGCAISKASASVMSTTIKGKTIAEAHEYFEIFHKLVTGEADIDEYFEKAGKIAAFGGVSEFPVRVKCASLPWHTMNSALENRENAVSTE
ncbi:MAG: SUF system NifU family Fe-S cluster assembly protein [Calditrichaceae bacterium]|jgi:nitrogen fixation NifU-like protein